MLNFLLLAKNKEDNSKKKNRIFHRKALSNLDGKENLNDSSYLKRVKVRDIIMEFENFKQESVRNHTSFIF